MFTVRLAQLFNVNEGTGFERFGYTAGLLLWRRPGGGPERGGIHCYAALSGVGWERIMIHFAVLFAALIVLVNSVSFAGTICPDGSYVGGDSCQICPDGSYVSGGAGCAITPKGSYVPARPGGPRIAPDGSYVPGGADTTICPDGSYVSGRCKIMPDGSYVGE